MSEYAKTKPLMTKEALLNRIESAFSELQKVVGSFDEAAMIKPLGQSAWSLKDALTHIASWEEILVRFHLGGEPFDEVIEMEGAQYRITSYDDINEHLFKRFQSLSVDEARAYLLESHKRVLAALEAFAEEQLHRPHPVLSTGEAESVTWIDYITANTYEHYEEHIAEL